MDHMIHPHTEILIIGTFNPDTAGNYADFYYGRRQNYLWRLLPSAFRDQDLKNASRRDKINFMAKYKIDFIDLIEEVCVDEGMEVNYNDDYLDDKVSKWKDVIGEINGLNHLKTACFTRKTFSGIPNIRNRISEIENYCKSRDIEFKYLITPSRVYSDAKQAEWDQFLK